MKDLKQLLEEAAGKYQDKAAVVLGHGGLSYAGLDEVSNKVANALLSIGVKRGDRVATLLANSLEFITIFFGIVKIGAVAVPLTNRYKLDEVASILGIAQPKVLAGESSCLEYLAPILPGFKYLKRVIAVGPGHDDQFLDYDDMVAGSPAHPVTTRLEPEDTALIAFTSGPTTQPRGAMITHRSLVMEAAISARGFQQTAEDIEMLFALPLHHMFGLAGLLLTALSQGSTVIMVPGFSLSHLLEAIERERATIFMGVPYVHALLVDLAEKEGIANDLSSLRLCGSAGAPLSTDLARRFKKHFGLDLIDFFGQTEAICHVTCPPLDGTGKPGSVGKALPGWEIKVIDDDDREMAPNEPGEIVLRGPIMRGYYNDPRATAAAIKGGWLHTGDIGSLDEDGYLYIVGRKKDMIIVKGQNIHPCDIEAVLQDHPQIAEAAVVGAPDTLRGEVVVAFVRLREGEAATAEDIRHFCRDHMANFKLPRQVIFVDSLPKTAAGKIDRDKLREQCSAASMVSLREHDMQRVE
ncbi:MAG: AMP-binding protein [Chloroflexi bacterium]|nr:AMP-binding protein [Chloroflexota bacterium]